MSRIELAPDTEALLTRWLESEDIPTDTLPDLPPDAAWGLRFAHRGVELEALAPRGRDVVLLRASVSVPVDEDPVTRRASVPERELLRDAILSDHERGAMEVETTEDPLDPCALLVTASRVLYAEGLTRQGFMDAVRWIRNVAHALHRLGPR